MTASPELGPVWPLGSGEVRVGTCSWADKTLVKDAAWYPKKTMTAAERLGAVLLQYPQWFTPKRANRDELTRARERLGDLPVCVELRSPRWFGPDDRDRTVGWPADHDLSLVVVDAPAVSELPAMVAATADLAVVRFHGRNDDTWKSSTATAAERFRYLYDKRELRPWVERVRQLAEHAAEVHVLMNNCFQDYGVRNAADMNDLLAGAT